MSLLIFILFVGIYSSEIPADVNFLPDRIPPAVKSVVCDGRNSSCPNNETCCQAKSGQYGCCPFSGAVCCSNQLHCCPNGYTCDIEHSRCQKQSQQTVGVVCYDGKTTCANGETCFQLESGDYGCCPFPNGVLCGDPNYCCPKKYTCDNQKKKCEKDSLIPWFTNKEGTPVNLQSKLIRPSLSLSSPSTIQCSDKKSVCSNNSTCCELTNSTYGCCPSPRATCCADKMHCCEEGHSCDESGSKCIRDVSLTPLSTFEEQTCPDGIIKCSTSSTCCPNENNGKTTYFCCPYARGVCCGSSCCPNKYACDEKKLTHQLNETLSTIDEDPYRCRFILSDTIASSHPWNTRSVIHSKPAGLLKDERCPDGSWCPQGCCSSNGGCRPGC